MNFSPKRALVVLSLAVVSVPSVSLVACSSDPASTTDGGATTATTTTTAPTTTTTTTTATTTTTTTTTTTAPDATVPDATAEGGLDAGSCTAKGQSDVTVRSANNGTDTANAVTIQMVDGCQGTGAVTPYPGTKTSFFPTNGANHHFLLTPTNPADFYKSASMVFNYPLAGIRNDTALRMVGKPGGGTADSYGANYDATKAHFMVQLNKLEATCDASGYTVSVVGHPEAVVEYNNGSGFAPVPGQTTSAGDRGGLAFVSKVNVGPGLVEIVGTKAGCKLVGLVVPVPIFTHKYPLIADTVTHLVMNTSL